MAIIDADATNQQLQAAYQQTFGSPIGRQVLADLAAYCHARKATFDENDRRHAYKDGQRDVFLRIQEFIGLTVEEIYNLRGIGRVRTQGDEE